MRNVLSYVNKFNSLYLRSVLLALTRNAIGTTETAKVLEIFRVPLGNLPRCGILAPQAIRQRRSGGRHGLSSYHRRHCLCVRRPARPSRQGDAAALRRSPGGASGRQRGTDGRGASAFAPVAALTVGSFRDWLLSDAASCDALRALSRGITPEMAAAVSKLMRNQDLIRVARKCEVTTRFRNTIGLRGRMSARLQPNHPFDDARGITASILDGLMLGSGDACIGINPASDDPAVIGGLLRLLDEIIGRLQIPAHGCVLTHVTTTLDLIGQGLPVDLVFQSVAGTEAANRSFGIDLALLREARAAGLSLRRGTIGDNVMYFETGQGSALSANAHHGVDQQTCEARAYAVARAFDPLLVNSVVGFIGPEYLYDGKEIIR